MKKLLIILICIFSFLLINTNNTYAANSCTLEGKTIISGTTIYGFKHRFSDDCNSVKKTRKCINGFLSGDKDYKYATCNRTTNLDGNNIDIGNTKAGNGIKNNYLDDLKGNQDINVGDDGEKSIKDLLVTSAKDLKIIFFIISGLYFLILVIKLLFAQNTEEEIGNFKKGILWITIGIILMQVSFYFVNTLYGEDVGSELANTFTKNIIEPIILILETATSFFFMLIAITAFYALITTNGDEEKAKTGKMTIFYAIIGFIVVKISRILIMSTYGKIDCNYSGVLSIFGGTCAAESDLSQTAQLIVDIINWLNSFIGIVVVIMIIYAGLQILFSAGDEEKITKAKKSILYIAIGLVLLALNYFILTFFVIPESTI